VYCTSCTVLPQSEAAAEAATEAAAVADSSAAATSSGVIRLLLLRIVRHSHFFASEIPALPPSPQFFVLKMSLYLCAGHTATARAAAAAAASDLPRGQFPQGVVHQASNGSLRKKKRT